jgi:flagellar biogenesis protein FliO
MNSPVHGWNRAASFGATANPAPAAPSSVATGKLPAAAARVLQMLGETCWRIWAAIESRRAAQKRRSLRVVETVGMGEKRFVAILQVEDQRFLVGGGSSGVSLLAKLDAAPEFAAALDPQQADLHSANRIREAW